MQEEQALPFLLVFPMSYFRRTSTSGHLVMHSPSKIADWRHIAITNMNLSITK